MVYKFTIFCLHIGAQARGAAPAHRVQGEPLVHVLKDAAAHS